MSAELLFCVPSSWSASSLRSLLGDEANNQVREKKQNIGRTLGRLRLLCRESCDYIFLFNTKLALTRCLHPNQDACPQVSCLHLHCTAANLLLLHSSPHHQSSSLIFAMNSCKARPPAAQGPGPVYSLLLNTSISKIEFRTVISCHHTVRGWALLHQQYLALCFIAAPN